MNATTASRLTGDEFAEAVISGIHQVIARQEHLNSINVFPVADSDTGTNLSLSLSSALAVVQDSSNRHLGTLLADLADCLLDSARGNSGAIMAQFFQGLSDAAGDLSEFTPGSFSDAVAQGSEYAHDALSQPREGTILSVIAAFAKSTRRQSRRDPHTTFANLFSEASRQVEVALADTPQQLDVLRKAGVVDAGAQGFAELVAGITAYLKDGTVTPMPDVALLQDIEPAVEFSAADNTSKFRFCTECLVAADDIDRRKLREALSTLGDSLVLAGSKRKAKIHIHVDDPDAVFDVVRQFGKLSGEKADDMHRQQHASHEPGRLFGVITDSGADIRDEDMERYDIHMIPCRIQFGDRGYLDKVSITGSEFYEALESSPHHPTTSQPTPGDFRRQFQFLASHYRDVISVNLTSQASGTYEAAVSAAKRSNARGRVHVIDSLNASVGQGRLVVLAAECAAAGLDAAATIRAVQSMVPKTRTYALLKDLRFAVRGGRLPQWVKTVTEILGLTPVICVTRAGRIGLGGCLLGHRNRLQKFVRLVASRIPRGEVVDISIGHALCPDDAARLAELLQDSVAVIRNLTTCELGSGIGVHGGPGTLIISFSPAVSVDDIAGGDD